MKVNGSNGGGSFNNNNNNNSSNLTLISLPPVGELSFFFEFFLPGVLLNGIGVLGLVGNLLAIFILSRPQMKGSTNCILIGLATYDIILILSRYVKADGVQPIPLSLLTSFMILYDTVNAANFGL